jgi:hypothetical protein
VDEETVTPALAGTDLASQEARPRIHGVTPRGLRNQPLSPLFEGRFGRLFRRLPPAPTYSVEELNALAETMREDSGANTGSWGQPNAQPEGGDNAAIPAAYTYFGQFIDHDITFDPASLLGRINDPDALHDFRTPRFDLDSLYGSGPADEPFQYDVDAPGRMLIKLNPSTSEHDLPRNEQQVALIGDPRNDENTIVSQLQVVFLRLHNKVAELVDADPAIQPEKRFEETQKRVRWHYQWVVTHDYLRRVCGEDVLNSKWDVRHGLPEIRLRWYRAQKNAYMPVEFSAAAFRFGHSQVRAAYDLNGVVPNVPIFAPGDDVGPRDDLRGRKTLPDQWEIDWPRFLPIGAAELVQPSRLIDGHLTPALFDLPRFPPGEHQSLALRNLLRGQALQLPSGQDVARHLRVNSVFSGGELGSQLDPTPLWFYILKESELVEAGQRLGPVGAQIVCEVLLGLLELDPQGYFKVQPDWEPTLEAADADAGFSLGDLVRFAVS